jgi:hypothetical protein
LFVRSAERLGPGGPLPVFRSDMTPSDITELFEATIGRITSTSIIDAKDATPVPFAEGDGFRFSYSMTLRDNVDRQGVACGTVRNGKLHLIAFHGARLHYFENGRPEIKRLVQSVQLPK